MSNTRRIIVIIAAIVLLPIIVILVTRITVKVIDAFIQAVDTFFSNLLLIGHGRIDSVISFSLYLIAIILLVKYLFWNRN